MSFKEAWTQYNPVEDGHAEKVIFSPAGIVYDALWQGPSDAVAPSGNTVRLVHGAGTPGQFKEYRELHFHFDTRTLDPTIQTLRAHFDITLDGYTLFDGNATLGIYNATVAVDTDLTIGDWHIIAGGNNPHDFFVAGDGPGNRTVTLDLPGSAINRGGYTVLALGWYLEPTWVDGFSEFVQFQMSGGASPPTLRVASKAFLGSAALI